MKVKMGQSPPSELVNEVGLGLPFLQGNAEFGAETPQPRYWCEDPPRRSSEGDLLISVRAPVGAINRSDKSYGIGRGLCALSPVLFDRHYAWYLACLVGAQLRAREKGSTYGAVTADDFREVGLPLPPLPTQRRIADFLDRETERIDALIDKKRRLIDLLEEKRTATITHAVTKGLDPTVAMKDSGITWIGEVPAHWEAAPVYSRYDVMLGKMLSPDASSGPDQLPYLRNANVHWDRIDLADLAEMHFSSQERDKYRLHPGDLLVCEGGQVGRAAIWEAQIPECYFQKALLRVTARVPGESQRLLMYLLWAAASMGVFVNEGNQATFLHLTAEKLRAHRFGFPPKKEQDRIVEFLDREGEAVDEAISKLTTQLSLLTEYREALITAAVTGEIDVETFDGERHLEEAAT